LPTIRSDALITGTADGIARAVADGESRRKLKGVGVEVARESALVVREIRIRNAVGTLGSKSGE